MPISTRFLLCCAVLASALSGSLARADESVANLDAGGLVLDRNDQIELRSEDLYLSAGQVRASYRFFNRGDQDLTLAATFSMPDVAGEESVVVNLPRPSSPNFLELQTRVDGRIVTASVEQRAVYVPRGGAETDITDLLGALGIPLLPVGDETKAALARLNAGDRSKLAESGYIRDGSETDALWTLRSKIRWQQAFPAKKEVVIEQSYRPSIGSSPGIFFNRTNLTGESLAQYQRKYCTTPGFLKAADLLAGRIAAAHTQAGGQGSEARQVYFGFAINRSEAIGRLRLIVDKAYPDNLVSFCGDDIKRLDGTRFEVTRANFTPDRNIDVLILDRHPQR